MRYGEGSEHAGNLRERIAELETLTRHLQGTLLNSSSPSITHMFSGRPLPRWADRQRQRRTQSESTPPIGSLSRKLRPQRRAISDEPTNDNNSSPIPDLFLSPPSPVSSYNDSMSDDFPVQDFWKMPGSSPTNPWLSANPLNLECEPLEASSNLHSGASHCSECQAGTPAGNALFDLSLKIQKTLGVLRGHPHQCDAYDHVKKLANYLLYVFSLHFPEYG